VKILMVAPQPFFQERGTPLSVLGRLDALSRLGHEVDLFTYHLGHDVSIPGVAIHRTPRIPFVRHVPVGPSVTKLLLDAVLFATVLARLFRTRYDILHTHEEASFFGALLARAFRVPHLYDMHSSLPEQLTNFRYAGFRPLIAVFEWLERWVIGRSSAVIAVCVALAEHVRRIDATVPQVTIENIGLETESDSVLNGDETAVRREYGCDGKRLVVYTGTLEAYQGIDLLIDSAERVVARHQDVVFLLVGGEPDLVSHYRELVARRDLSPYIRFAGSRRREQMPPLLRSADVLVSPRSRGMNSPLKLYSYLRSGKPIVATDVPAHTQILNAEVALLARAEPQSFADAVVSLLEDRELAVELGGNARRFFDRRYSMQMVLDATEDVLRMAAFSAGKRGIPIGTDLSYAEGYDDDRFGSAFGRVLENGEVALFMSIVDDTPGRTLDLGCGTGKLSLPLLERSRHVISADRSAEMLRVLGSKARASGVRPVPVICDAHHLPFRDGAFDSVVSSRMLMHVTDWRRSLSEASRVSARVVAVDLPPRRSLSGLAFVVKQWMRIDRTSSPSSISAGAAMRELERHGFGVESSEREFFLPVALHRLIDRPAISARFEAVCRRLGLVRLFGAPVTLKAVRRSSLGHAGARL
jgi:glycosyltransferase involved in cell wall biosynthesis